MVVGLQFTVLCENSDIAIRYLEAFRRANGAQKAVAGQQRTRNFRAVGSVVRNHCSSAGAGRTHWVGCVPNLSEQREPSRCFHETERENGRTLNRRMKTVGDEPWFLPESHFCGKSGNATKRIGSIDDPSRLAHVDAQVANWIERISFRPMRFKSNMRKRSRRIGSGRPLILNVKEGIQDCKLIPSVKR